MDLQDKLWNSPILNIDLEANYKYLQLKVHLFTPKQKKKEKSLLKNIPSWLGALLECLGINNPGRTIWIWAFKTV